MRQEWAGALATIEGGFVGTGRSGTERFHGFDLEGQSRWTVDLPELPQFYTDVAAMPDARGFVGFAFTPLSSSPGVIDGFSASGTDWQRAPTAPNGISFDLVAEADGGYALLHDSYPHEDSRVVIVAANGERHEFGPPVPADGTRVDGGGNYIVVGRFTALTRHPDGDLIVAVRLNKTAHVGEIALETGFAIIKLTRTGQPVWVKSVPGTGTVNDLGTSRDGRIYATVRLPPCGSWAGESLCANAALLTLDSAGAELWGRALHGGLDWYSSADELAVDPATGDAVAITGTPPRETTVERFAANGALRWAHVLRTENPAGFESVEVVTTSVTIAESHAIVSGYFNGAADFGDGFTLTVGESYEGFLINLGK